jgi:hypothetical protein
MNKAEMIAQQMADGNSIAKIWGDLLFNVKSYGAKGNGVKDDTAAIQSAIYAAYAAGGGIVRFPTGTYCCWNLAMKPNVVLVGNKGATLKRINNASQLHWITADSITNFGIMNLTLDGNKALTPTYPYTDTLSFINSGKFVIDDVTVMNSVNRGIYIEKNTDINNKTLSKVVKSTITNSDSANIWARDCSDLNINDNVISLSHDNGVIVEYTTNRYTSGNNVRVERNKVLNNDNVGIWCYSNYATSSDRQTQIGILNISDNEVHHNGSHGIITQINESHLINNDIHDNVGTGLTVNTSKVTISGGSIERNGNNGIDLGDCFNTIIQSVIIEENGTTGIEVNSCEEVLIDSCFIRYNNSTNVAAPFGANNAIYIYQGTDGSANPFPGNSKNILVKNCVIRRKVGYFQDYGIRVGNTANRVSLIGNDVKDSGNTDDFKIENIECLMIGNVSKNNDYNSAQANLVSAIDLFIPPDGDVFFVDGTATIKNIITSGFGVSTLPARKGRKITLVLNSQFITLFAGNGSNTGNLLNNGDANVSGFLKIVEYICIGGSWLQYSASAGR